MSDTVPVPAAELAHLRSVYAAARKVAALDMASRRGRSPDRMSVIQAHRALVALFEGGRQW